MSSDEMARVVERLCEISREQNVDPYSYIDWPEAVDPEAWYTTPELISLYGTDIYEGLSVSDQKRLSFFEAVNFYSLNIHGEKTLIEGLARRLYENTAVSPYLHHFLDEENKHMVYFGGFCLRYAGRTYPDRRVVFPRDYAPGEEDFLFFAKVLVFEEIVDVYNVRMSRDERLAPVARAINTIHHREEMRHLVFGRQFTKLLWDEHSPRWSPETLLGVREHLTQYLGSTWREYYNPDIYRDLGLSDPYATAQEAFDHPAPRAHRLQVSARCIEYLVGEGILEEAPSL
ncbi:MAG TPA: diiron oxygenase [Candidatus Eisenbacteria bacterium]|nr:diiron oxygenase [Candidatus Eisenbacteria bacterium]